MVYWEGAKLFAKALLISIAVDAILPVVVAHEVGRPFAWSMLRATGGSEDSTIKRDRFRMGATPDREDRAPMTKAALLLIVSLSASMIGSAVAAPTGRNCTGSLIQPSGDAPAAKSMKLVVGPPTSLDQGNGPKSVTALSNNKIQLKFKTPDFTGEYFHYTGDLFLIYKTGHLARLTCSDT